jgi:16S rRNA (adenine1518-N6/adenine1519-N6)-dimethyltransferase
MYVKAKKSLGQHFLKNHGIAERIVSSLVFGKENAPLREERIHKVLEIGPGTGVLTGLLLERDDVDLAVIEIDKESIEYLRINYPQLTGRMIEGDFLKTELASLYSRDFYIIGNFPYNISSQIFFRILDHRDQIPEVVCMIQREVAIRLASGPGNRDYGILSVLLQAWYRIEYLFTVDEQQFLPPPKVKSAVIRLTRNERWKMDCKEELFRKVVKTTFNQRRKTIRNSIGQLLSKENVEKLPYTGMRPEQLNVEQFIELTRALESILN